jgi:hypothetical protein
LVDLGAAADWHPPLVAAAAPIDQAIADAGYAALRPVRGAGPGGPAPSHGHA